METFKDRLIKTEVEIENLREAARRSSMVHEALLRTRLAGRRESEIKTLIEDAFRAHGMGETAYETIVGGGERSVVLHARATDRVLQEEDLVVIDAGGKWNGYCADITRTLPVGARFTDRQRKIYEIVLHAQKAAIAAVRPGVTLTGVEAVTRRALTEGLRSFGYTNEEIAECLPRWMPHKTSHWLGRNVHDRCPYVDENGDPIRLEAGMVLTIEPGLYFEQGVRIEDDVVVTETGVEVLTPVTKELAVLESMRPK